jgi:hypothetical protein
MDMICQLIPIDPDDPIRLSRMSGEKLIHYRDGLVAVAKRNTGMIHNMFEAEIKRVDAEIDRRKENQ